MDFIPDAAEEAAMLAALGRESVEELFSEVPEAVRLRFPLNLPPASSEWEVREELRALADLNRPDLISFRGGGAADRFTPAVVSSLLSRGEFFTAYTPYQAEASQGTLTAMYEFQSLVAELTGLPVATASHYDGSTAVAEAALLAARATGRKRILVPETLNPRYRQVLATYVQAVGVELEIVPAPSGRCDPVLVRELAEGAAALVVPQPNFLGLFEPLAELVEEIHRAGGLLIVVPDASLLALLPSPGSVGADLAAGEGQGWGLPLSYGGPFLGFLASRTEYRRLLPGRLAGATVDASGRRGYVLTLQAREQHIRREKATSNICSNQALMALAATVYLVAMGPENLRRVGQRSLAGAAELATGLLAQGWRRPFPGPFGYEVALRAPEPPERILRRLEAAGYLGGLNLGRLSPSWEGLVLWTVTEKRTPEEIQGLLRALLP